VFQGFHWRKGLHQSESLVCRGQSGFWCPDIHDYAVLETITPPG
jgi:hypothetical protein